MLHLAVNEDEKELQVTKELSLEKAVLLPSYHYHDNIEQYDPQEVLVAMKKELDKLRQKDMYVSIPNHNYLLSNYEKLSRLDGFLLSDLKRVLLLLVSYVQGLQ